MDCSRPARRGAFSLAELIVAIGILVLMFSLAGQVFNLTIESTGQATALTEVNQVLRAFERTIREELAEVRPGASMILIQGNPVNAYWTWQGREADQDGDPATGYPHASDPTREDADGNLVKPRADILMFFTSRTGSSFVYPDAELDNVRMQQVVYGHAELGEYVRGTSDYEFEEGLVAFPVDKKSEYPSETEISQVPAEDWHLARRGVLFPQNDLPTITPPWVEPNLATARGLADERILLGETDVVGNFKYDDYVLKPMDATDWHLPEIFKKALDNKNPDYLPFRRSRLDPTPPVPLAGRLGHYFLPNCASFKVEWTLDPRSEFVAGRLDGEREVYWFDPGRYDVDDRENEHPLTELQEAVDAAGMADQDDDRLRQRHLNLKDLLEGRTSHPDGLKYSLSDRFLGESYYPNSGWRELAKEFVDEEDNARPNLVVFGAARRNKSGETVAEDLFPAALRITIDVFDDERRLGRPIRHVIVASVGGE